MMNMESRNQYLLEIRDEYLKTKSKKGRGRLLNEAVKRTGLNRKYLIRKLKPLRNLDKGEAIIGRGQERVRDGLDSISSRLPFTLKEIHSDNDSGIINQLIWRWTEEKGIAFSRSRPNKKNDNAYIEQKNWTHVRKVFGYYRYDTKEEQEIINDLYHNELRLYKNFFQPVMKLKEKVRIGGRIHRKYDEPKTPCQRLMASKDISEEVKQTLTILYHALNPAALKRAIDAKRNFLYQTYHAKHTKTKKVEPMKEKVNTLYGYKLYD